MLHTTSFRGHGRILLALALALTGLALVLTPSAHALTVGAEANGELINSDRTPAQQAEVLDRMQAQGVQLVRVNVGWSDIAAGCGKLTAQRQKNPDNGCYNWAVLDSLVQLATARNIKVLASTSRAPAWLHPKKPKKLTPFQQLSYVGATKNEYARTVAFYSAFVAAAATRYKTGSAHGTIPYWTIWNEPNSKDFFGPKPDADRYALMYAKAAVAIKTAFPGALVAPGPTGPKSTIKPVPFITAFQKSVVKYLPKGNPRTYINAWAHNPYPFKNGPRGYEAGTNKGTSFGISFNKQGALGMAETPKLIKLLDSSKVTKGIPIWGTEFGWETAPEYRKDLFVSEALQAQYIAEAFDYFTQLKRVTIAVSYGLTDPATVDTDWQSGTFKADGTPKPSFYMFQRPIAASKGSVNIGSTVRVYGRSTVSSGTSNLVYRTTSPLAETACTAQTPDFCWQFVKNASRQADGSWVANVKITGAETYFSVYDGVATPATGNSGYGYYRRVLGL